MNTARIRRADAADHPALNRLAAACGLCPPSADEHLWLAESQDGTALAYIACRQIHDEMHLHAIAVTPAARRQQLARRLHQTAREALAPQNAYLEVRADNHAAQQLYRGLGYQQNGRRKHYYPNPDGSREDALLMHLHTAANP